MRKSLLAMAGAAQMTVVSVVLALGCSGPVRSIETNAPSSAVKEASSNYTRQFLTAINQSATEAGASPMEILSFGGGITGDSHGGLVTVPEGRCVLLAARGGPGVKDLDLLVYGDDGQSFGVDEAPDELPTLLICPAKATRLFVLTRIAQGSGPVATGIFDLPAGQAQTVRRKTGARPPAPEDVDPAYWPGLSEKITERRSLLNSSWSDLKRVPLAVDSRLPTRLSLTAPPETCVDVLALPGDGITRLDLEAQDGAGRIIARAKEHGRDRNLLLCAGPQEESVDLSLRPHDGRGLALVAVSQAPRAAVIRQLRKKSDAVDLSPGPEASTPKQPATPGSTRKKDLSVGRLDSIEVGPRGCTRLSFTPRYPLLGFEARAYLASGDLIAETGGRGPRELLVCSRLPVQVMLEATGRAGPIEITEEPLRGSHPAALDLPLAASRLHEHRGSAPSGAATAAPFAVTLQPDHLHQQDVKVEAKTCLSVTAALDRGPATLEARLVEAKSGFERDLARGRSSAQVRACNPRDAADLFRLELRTLGGSAKALVGVDTHPVE